MYQIKTTQFTHPGGDSLVHFELGDYVLDFDPVNHEYFVDGEKVASVSDIVNDLYPRSMKNVDPEILKKAAERGSELREMIEHYERSDQKIYHKEMHSYLSLKGEHQIQVQNTKVPVLIHHHGVVIAAGRFDMVVKSPYIKGEGIAQIKRAAHIDKWRLELQMNLYKLGFEQTYKQKIHYLKCIHIRNRHREYIDVMKNKKRTLDMLDTYIERHPIDYTRYL